MLQIPKYIESARIVDEPLGFEWDELQKDEVLLDQPRLMRRLNAISYRGVLSFSLGVIEWIIWRLSRHLKELKEERPFQATEAAWAGAIDWRYLKSLELPEWEEEFDESVGGPLALGFELLTEVFIEARRVRPVSQSAAPLSEIPIKILPKTDSYKEWRRSTIQRLKQVYPMKDQDRLGQPVPREALETSLDYRPELASEYLAKFLRECNPNENPYLSSPEEMIRAGFKGVPY